MFRNKNLASHPTPQPPSPEGEAASPARMVESVAHPSCSNKKNVHTDHVVLVSSKSANTVITQKDDLVTKNRRKKKKSVAATSRLLCKYCGKKYAAKGYKTHVKACQSKNDSSRYTQTTITTSNTNQK